MIFLTKQEKRVLAASVMLALIAANVQTVFAMHIMEGYLPAAHCILWGVACIPFLAYGMIRIRRTVREKRRALILLAMSGAFIFVISALKIPSVTASCSHMTGTGLSAILFGPAVTGVLGVIVLIFQAVLLAHGGVTTLGANTFSMAVAGPLLSFGIYRLGNACRWNRKITIFLAAAAGDLFTYCITSVQLALAHPAVEGGFFEALGGFLGIFALTQFPLAIIEGILTVFIMMGMESYAGDELKEIGFLTTNRQEEIGE